MWLLALKIVGVTVLTLGLLALLAVVVVVGYIEWQAYIGNNPFQ